MKHARSDYDRFQDPDGLIPDDEPVFIVRGQDKSAPETLRAWAREHVRRSGSAVLAAAVRNHAVAMEVWQEKHGAKVADAPRESLR